jgi:hypothetical protein
MMNEGFPGSYHDEEVTFLMRPLNLESTPLEERERSIQSGRRHYSEMIGPEDAPTRQRMRLFRECLESNGDRMAKDICTLAEGMAASAVSGELTVVSIARAGTPIGVLLWHRLRKMFPVIDSKHFSISVIRDRGVDFAALEKIVESRSPESIRFVDGWTGKGTIADELHISIAGWKYAPEGLRPGLWVPLDVCGASEFAASCEDYLIPSTLLGGTLSGLISRSVLPKGEEGGKEFHGCVPLDSLRRYDLSRWFIQVMLGRMNKIPRGGVPCENASRGASRRTETHLCLEAMLTRQGHSDRNRIKLGIGETVRVLLRRKPKEILLAPTARPTDADLIQRLAALRDVPVFTEAGLPFDAIAVIASA